MKPLLLLFVLALVSGCIVPGSVSVSKSNFDGSTEIHTEPAFVYDGVFTSEIMFSLHRNSTMQPGEVILTASASKNIADGPSLKINLDGEIVSFTSIDSTSEIFTAPVGTSRAAVRCAKRYKVDIDLLNRMMRGTNVMVRLELFRTFAEGRFSVDGASTARPAFRRFLAALDPSSATNTPATPVVTRGGHK